MNIKKAKEQIIDTVRAYLARDEYGRYMIPSSKQRPLFLIGPPGIGKTAIMEQIASELGIGLLSYSMTHHTRQSALGLPVIKKNEYKGESFEVTEYTMSEILSSVYSLMSRSGMENGILFLDEINCISETIMPIMLQFLQYKVFGGHRLPEGWVVVTAGNPPEYNNSVREFDIVTLDRLKVIEASPDLASWKEYAYASGVHGAVLTYLEIKPRHFYKIEAAPGGKTFVTARGWEDLSRVLTVYEKLGIKAGKELISQYLRNSTIADDFAVYYELYDKYKSDYQVGGILSGEAGDEVRERAKQARFDERYSLLGLLLEAISEGSADLLEREELLTVIRQAVSEAREADDPAGVFEKKAGECRTEKQRLAEAGALSRARDDALTAQADLYLRFRTASADGIGGAESLYREKVGEFRDRLLTVKAQYSNMFAFCEEVFGNGQELLILVTELAASPACAGYIAAYGCEEYHKHDRALMIHERRLGILDEIDGLES